MHIPDGFLDVKTCVTTYVAAGGGLGYSLKRLKGQFAEQQIPLFGLLGAFIFAAQMINLPVAAGTSGHLLGGVLSTLIVGPWAASVILTSILLIQSIFFMDGGLGALGANVFNMAIVGVFLGYALFIGFGKVCKSLKVRIFLSAMLSTVIAAGVAAVELALSGTVPLSVVLPAMLGWHILIGLIEGSITVLVMSYLMKVIPERLNITRFKRGE